MAEDPSLLCNQCRCILDDWGIIRIRHCCHDDRSFWRMPVSVSQKVMHSSFCPSRERTCPLQLSSRDGGLEHLPNFRNNASSLDDLLITLLKIDHNIPLLPFFQNL